MKFGAEAATAAEHAAVNNLAKAEDQEVILEKQQEWFLAKHIEFVQAAAAAVLKVLAAHLVFQVMSVIQGLQLIQ